MEKRIELERRGKDPSQVSELILDNCRATQIEGLTDEYTSLEFLSMINVGLTSLKGFPKLPELKRLELSDNRISTGLGALKECPKLSHLSISNNKIKDLESLEPLQCFKNLTHLDLFNNDVCNCEDYRSKMFKMLPSLKFLDDADADGNEADDSDAEEGQNGGLDEEGSDEDDADGEEGEEEEDEDEEDSEEDEDGPGLSAIYNDHLDEEDDGDFEETGEEEDEDGEEEEDEEESHEPRGKRRRVEEDGEGGEDA